jgi:DNA-binding NarL/FixJ family response regulator
VARGDALLAPGITRRLIAEFASRRPASSAAAAAMSTLTERERDVLRLVAKGMSNQELAEALQ